MADVFSDTPLRDRFPLAEIKVMGRRIVFPSKRASMGEKPRGPVAEQRAATRHFERCNYLARDAMLCFLACEQVREEVC